MDNTCEICGNRSAPVVTQQLAGGKAARGRDCPRCGKFLLEGATYSLLLRMLESRELDPSVLSHRVRGRYEGGTDPVALPEEHLRLYAGDRLPTPLQQFDNLILWIGSTQRQPDQGAKAKYMRIAALVGTAVTAERSDEPALNWLHGAIIEDGLYHVTGDGEFWNLRLTMEGWKRYEQLRARKTDSKTAFMAMKFNDATLTRVLDQCVKPAVARAGFTLRPLNEEQPAGLIDNQIRAAIRSARFVIADLTHDNNGAYFEAGFAEGIGLPVIYTCEAGKFRNKTTHFDTNHMHTIPWDEDKLDDAARRLTATIRATLPSEAKMNDD